MAATYKTEFQPEWKPIDGVSVSDGGSITTGSRNNSGGEIGANIIVSLSGTGTDADGISVEFWSSNDDVVYGRTILGTMASPGTDNTPITFTVTILPKYYKIKITNNSGATIIVTVSVMENHIVRA